MRYIEKTIALTLDQNKCNGCQICIQVCPHDVFEMTAKKASIRDKGACMECGACAKNCRAEAITARSGVGCAYAIIQGYLRKTEPSCDCSRDDDDEKKGCC